MKAEMIIKVESKDDKRKKAVYDALDTIEDLIGMIAVLKRVVTDLGANETAVQCMIQTVLACESAKMFALTKEEFEIELDETVECIKRAIGEEDD